MSVRQAKRIRRKAHIPESVRTEGKDDAAETIDAIIEAGEWPMDLTEIAERAGWSRQHIANTVGFHIHSEATVFTMGGAMATVDRRDAPKGDVVVHSSFGSDPT